MVSRALPPSSVYYNLFTGKIYFSSRRHILLLSPLIYCKVDLSSMEDGNIRLVRYFASSFDGMTLFPMSQFQTFKTSRTTEIKL